MKQLFSIVAILFGNTLYALAVACFLLPSGLITGGTTGLALFFNHYWGISVSSFALVFNITMFLIGLAVLGRKFAFTTLLSTFYYPIILGIFLKIPQLQTITSDTLLSTIYAGAMIGIGIGIVIRAGASTGGMDIPPLVLHKLKGFPISLSMYLFDFTILILQMIFSNKEQILYGILLVFFYTAVLDKVLILGESKTQVKIISKEYQAINDMIIHELDRGSTLLDAKTGYLDHKLPVVLTVISNRELSQLNQMIQKIDPDAFLIISSVNEVKGHGFTSDKVYR